MSFCVRSGAGYWFGPKEYEGEIDIWQKKHVNAFKCEEEILARWIAKALPKSASPEVVEVTYGLRWRSLFDYTDDGYYSHEDVVFVWERDRRDAMRFQTYAEAFALIHDGDRDGWAEDFGKNLKIVRFTRRVKP